MRPLLPQCGHLFTAVEGRREGGRDGGMIFGREGVMDGGLDERREGETSLRSRRLEVRYGRRKERVSPSSVPFFLAPRERRTDGGWKRSNL